jgi:putative FmdB family regulatory protein
MPIYEYECPKCGAFEHSQSIHDRPLHKCPKCRRKVQRLISASSFQLRGGGWYAQGYQKSGSSSESKGPSTESSASKKPEKSTTSSSGESSSS